MLYCVSSCRTGNVHDCLREPPPAGVRYQVGVCRAAIRPETPPLRTHSASSDWLLGSLTTTIQRRKPGRPGAAVNTALVAVQMRESSCSTILLWFVIQLAPACLCAEMGHEMQPRTSCPCRCFTKDGTQCRWAGLPFQAWPGL